MNRSTPGVPVHHQLPEFIQTHAHRVGDAIQPSHPLLSPSPPAPNPSQHQGLFQWVSSSHQVANVLEFQLQHQSFQWTPRTDVLFSNTTVQKHQFFSAQVSSQSAICGHMSGFPGGSGVKNLPVVKETKVQSLGWEDPLEKEMQPTPLFLSGESHGQWSLAGYSPWVCNESDMT